ncbi:MAG: NlpC/P60 family protein [Actinomycetota bacterium]
MTDRQRSLLDAIGAPYSWGAGDLQDALDRWPAGPFDCSGFAQACLRVLDIVQPTAWTDKSAGGLADACDPIPLDRVQLGDLAFYGEPGHITHVVVALDDHMAIGCNGGTGATHGDNPRACVQVRPICYRGDLVVCGRLKLRYRRIT